MGRTPCCDKTGLKKGPWTSEEDKKLVDYINKHGYGNWRTLPKNAGLQRCGKSCRLRWTNYLRPDIKRGRFSFEEEEVIIQLHSILGNKWSAIAARLPGRTDNEIKNYWNTNIRKRLLRMGIDPVTHSPRIDLLDMSSILMNNNKNFNNYYSSSLSTPQMNLTNLASQDLLALLTQIRAGSNPLMAPTTTQIQTPIPNIGASSSTPSPCVPFFDETQLFNPNIEQYTSNVFSLDDQNSIQWQKNNGLVDIDQSMSFGSYGFDQNLYNYHEEQNSVMNLATFSSHAALNSNSNSNSNSTIVNGNWTDEEMDPSYTSDMSNFVFSDNILDVNQFLLTHTN